MGKVISDAELDDLVRQELGEDILRWNPIIGWDLDSTLCYTLHRAHLVPEIRAGRATWEDYSLRSSEDTPMEGSVALMRELAGYSHVAISGRSACAVGMTAEWAERYDVPLVRIILRPDGDHTPNGKWKVRVLQAIRRRGGDVRLFFEDWSEAAAVIRQDTGIPVVGINPFYPPRDDPRNENSPL